MVTRTTIIRRIDAPIDRVFETVAHAENFVQAVPQIVKIDVLGDVQRGVGTRLRETRLMGKREATTDLEITEYVENDCVRLVADSHGTVWDTVFTTREIEGQTELTMVMDARAHKLLPKLINPLMRGMIQKLIEKDMDAVKAYCEAPG